METKIKEQLIDIKDIPNALFGKNLNEEQRKKLSYGEGVFLENMELTDGSVRDGKISLVKGKDQQLSTKIDFKNEKLEIGDELLGKKLTEEEKSDLKQGKIIKIETEGKNIYAQIDNELNKVTFKTEKELNPIKEIGGYKLSEKETLALMSGEALKTKVFKHPQKDFYFMAEASLTPDKTGLSFQNFKEIPPHQAQEMIDKYNRSPNDTKVSDMADTFKAINTNDNNLSNMAETFKSVNNPKEQIIETSKENSDKEFKEAIDKKDFQAMNELSKTKTPSPAILEHINLSSLSQDEKTTAKICCGIKDKPQENIIKQETKKEPNTTKNLSI